MRLDLRHPVVGLAAALALGGIYALLLWLIVRTPGWGSEIGWTLHALGLGGAVYLRWKHRNAPKPA
jgi:hypothetical protein